MSVNANGSLSGRVVTVLGGTGFVGCHLAQELLSRGARLRLVSRHPQKAWRIRPLGNLGQMQSVPLDVTRTQDLSRVFAGSDAVINLMGAFAGNLDALQGKGLARIATAARETGVERFIHISAIGADAGSQVAYARTKGEGEAAVLSAFPNATIVRPSILFGDDDNFVMMFGRLIAKAPALPVFGPHAKIQPLFVDDAAEAIANAILLPEAQGRTYEIAGPEVITMLELNQRIAAAQCRKRAFIELPDAVSGAIASVPLAPISRDQWALLKAGNMADASQPGIAELGVTPRPLSLFLERWMVQFRKNGRFNEGSTIPAEGPKF
ncbi:NADH dehydrogenase [Novosphingobium chloroacetimidivorans]|uniref:NADH dehydrogenase n=1 Tax=Novosphingobium chloroacetimidivorans TaxID=1428314 RepID=A0A7W7K783_9SPHN|nr:complex I NDUFA9 subunit family protein [Novosphingobium chloroacetimidivorans]MBB4857534.1 NADH dehydrogenase [Novosphingobium chloroacetimidivorans]